MAQEDYLVKFYIKNFKKNGSVVKDETLMQTIPLTDTESAIKDPKIKGEIGKAGSMDFGMEPNNPYYDSMMQMKTIIRVVYAGKTIFHGRVLTIDKGFWASRQIHCEGSFAYLLDSHQEGTKEESRSTITVEKYMGQIIAAHNADVEADKRFELGEVPGKYKTASSEQRVKIPSDKAKQKFGSTSWDTAMNRLEDLLDNFGGYFRVRYDEKTHKNILDWLDKYYEDETNRQSIEVAKNLIDLSGTTEVDNLFTIVVPIGKSESDDVFISDYWPTASSGHKKVKYIQVPELATLGLCKDSELNAFYHKKADYADAINRYGKIWKPVDFENANTPEKLFKYAVDWIKNNYMPEMTQWSVTALDLRTYDSSEQPLMVGDRVKLRHPEVVDSFGSFTVISAEYDLYHMEKTKYTIGVPNPIVNATYGVKQKQNKSGKRGGKGKGGGGGGGKNTDNPPPEGDDFQTKLKSILQQQYSLKTDWGQDITLDNPLAFLSHNTNGQRFTAEYFMKQLRPYNKDLIQASKRYDNPLNLAVDAGKYGLDPNDPNTKTTLMGKWMVDHNPSMKEYQSYWKTTTENYMVGTLGLTEQEAGVLLNESSGTSWLAGMVDDNGNWTEAALRSGITIRPNKDQIKQQAIATRKLLNKDEGSWAGTHIVNGIQEYIVGDKLDLGNFLFADGENLTFDLGQMFNLDGVKNIFKLISNAMNLDGENGNAKFGSKGNWKIAINTPITYKDIDGNEHTIGGDGMVGAVDFNLPTLPSFYSKLVTTDTIISNQAIFNETVTNKLTVLDSITASKITANTYVSADKGYFNSIKVTSIDSGSNSQGGHGNLLSAVFVAFAFAADGDEIKLQGVRYNGSAYEDLASFNIAATKKYIADVAAARKTGRNDVYVNDVYIGAGESNTYKLHYTDPSTGHEMNTGKTFKVTASGGSYSLSANLASSGPNAYDDGINITMNKYHSYGKIDVYVNGTFVDHIDIHLA